MQLSTTPFDPADVLDCEEAFEAYLASAIESGEPEVIADACRVLSRAVELSHSQTG